MSLIVRISIQNKQSSVKNQFDRPTCVAFAVTSLHEYTHDVLRASCARAEIDLSEEFLYFCCKRQDSLPRTCNGTTVAAAAMSLSREGQPHEDLYPYHRHISSSLKPPSKTARADAKLRKLPGLKLLANDIESIESGLQEGRPIICVTDWYSNSYLAPLGHIHMPEAGDRLLGRHAVLIVEVEKQSESANYSIVFKNSWGPKWGNAGFGRFGLDYFTSFSRELWGLTS